MTILLLFTNKYTNTNHDDWTWNWYCTNACFITRMTLSTKQKEQKQQGQEQEQLVFGTIILYFGCHAYNKGYLYREELQAFVQDETLTQMHVAFSHEQEEEEQQEQQQQEQQQEQQLRQETTTTKIMMTMNNKNKVYVQHLLLQQAQETYQLIYEPGAYSKVCGGVQMGYDVHDTLCQSLNVQYNKNDNNKNNKMNSKNKNDNNKEISLKSKSLETTISSSSSSLSSSSCSSFLPRNIWIN